MDVLMPRKKRGELKRMPIDLDMDDPRQRALWEHWLALTAEGKASKWVRDTLIAALPAQPKRVEQMNRPAKPTNSNHVNEPHYETIDE